MKRNSMLRPTMRDLMKENAKLLQVLYATQDKVRELTQELTINRTGSRRAVQMAKRYAVEATPVFLDFDYGAPVPDRFDYGAF